MGYAQGFGARRANRMSKQRNIDKLFEGRYFDREAGFGLFRNVRF
jgi:hypothetical protein